jgi:mediator of RNA polymerase II transcription subunit 12
MERKFTLLNSKANVSSGAIISHVLHVLEALDQHNFDKVEASCSLDSLYHKVFGGNHSKDSSVSILMLL